LAASLPLHRAARDEQVQIAPRSEAMCGAHGDLLIPPHPLRAQGGKQRHRFDMSAR